MATIEGRFWSKVDTCGVDECWEWEAGRTTNGYGSFYADKDHRHVRAHRFSYELAHGPIPEGLQIDHICRNRLCVNPAHLEAVTQYENIMRGEGPPAQNAQKLYCKSGHALTPKNTYVNRHGHRQCRPCHAEWMRQSRLSTPQRKGNQGEKEVGH